MTQNNEREALLDKLLAEYWDIAYSEGNSGLRHGKKAQSTLNDIRKLFKTQSPISQNEHQEVVGYIDEFGNFENSLKQWMIDETDIKWKPLYTSPKLIPDGWNPISEEQIEFIALQDKFWKGTFNNDKIDWMMFAKEIENKLRELNAAPTHTE